MKTNSWTTAGQETIIESEARTAVVQLKSEAHYIYIYTSDSFSSSLPSADSRRAVSSFWRKNVHNTP